MRTNPLLYCLAMFLVSRPAVIAQPNPPGGPPPRHVEGELLVKFASGPRGAAAEQARNRMNHEVKRRFDFIGWQQIRLPHGMSVEEGLARYRNLPGVLAVEPNGLMQVIDPAAPPVRFQPASEPTQTAPNDPMFPQQWGLAKIGASNAWAVTTGSTNVVVAVIDSGINYNHEDLRANMWRNPGEIPGNGIDDDGNGFVDDVYGIDTADDQFGNDSDPWDQALSGFYHGSAVAGIVGAVGNNAKGITGVNWSVHLMALRCLAANNTVSAADHIQALDYVVLMKQRGVHLRVVSTSFGGTGAAFFSQAQKDAMDVVAAHGIVQVAGAGNAANNNDQIPHYPASYATSNLIAVAASDQSDNLTAFASYGRTNVDLAAPGLVLLTTSGETTNAYYSDGVSGASFACPHVSGAAALLFAANPSATAEDVKAALLESVDVLPAFTNKMVSNGRLNVGRAMYHPNIISNAPPIIAAQPRSQTTNEGTNTSFSAIAYGTPPLTYQWQRQGQPLANKTNASLSLTNLTAAHTGDYALVVSNAFGTVTSAVASLTVLTIPRLVGPSPPLQLSAVPGEIVTFSAETTGTLPIGYRWRHLRTNGTAVNLTSLVLTQHTCFVTLLVGINSAGSYTVILTNAAQPSSGIQLTNAVLTVLADSDGDGLPDMWELAYPTAGNPAEDTDHDGLTNLQEYRAGTDPTNTLSCLRVEALGLTNGGTAARFSFFAASNMTYTVESRGAVDTGEWVRKADVVAAATNRVVEIIDPTTTPADVQRYHRLVTPRRP